MHKAGAATTKWRGLSQQSDGGAVLIYSRCHGCKTHNIVSQKGVEIECTFCHRTYQEGETAQDYQNQRQLEEQRKHEALEGLRNNREKRINDMKTRMKTNPEVRATEYLENLRNGGFPSKAGLSNNAHIYVLKLSKPEGKYWRQHRFPNEEYPVLVDPDSEECKGFVYVGHTQHAFQTNMRTSSSTTVTRFCTDFMKNTSQARATIHGWSITITLAKISRPADEN